MARRVAVGMLLALTMAALGASHASAAVIHPQIGSFTGADSDAGAFTPFQEMQIAADESTGSVYVLDKGNPEAGKNDAFLSKFDADGVAQDFSFLESSSINISETCSKGLPLRNNPDIAVDNSGGPKAGTIYVHGYFSEATAGGRTQAGVCAYSPAGEFLWKLTQFEGPCGVAVDSTGSLWVADAPFSVGGGGPGPSVKKFAAAGSPPKIISSVTTPGGGCRPAVDPANNLYVVRGATGPVDKYRSGSLERTLDAGATAVDIAVDPVSGHVYTRTMERFSEFKADGTLVSRSAGGEWASSISVNGDLGRVYTVGIFGAANIYGPHVPVPDADTGPAVDVAHATATLTGDVGLDGPPADECRFDWGTDANYGNSVPCDQVTPYASDTAVTAGLTGLNPETTYHYRLVAANSNGPKEGVDMTFTPRAVLGVETEAATEITTSSATLNGSLDPDGIATDYYFEYGADTSYGFTTAAQSAGSGSTAVQVDTPVSDLAEGQRYHYRLVATNELGTTYGPDVSFRTAQPPTVEAFFFDEVAATTARLNARINPQGLPTTYRFEWGATAALGEVTPVPDGQLPASVTGQDVSAHLSGLQAGNTYFFRVVATNELGTRTTPIQSFDYSPPNCPNAGIRQQTGAGYLPDCRAYELVSPANAGGTTLMAGGPSSPDATDPSRFAFVGTYGQIPGTNNPINNAGDLYMATRTGEGWVTKYIGLPASESSAMTGFPGKVNGAPDDTQDWVMTNRSMDTILNWNNGLGLQVSAGWGVSVQDENNQTVVSSAPYVWNADGTFKDRWPTNLEVTDVESYSCNLGPGSSARCQNFWGDMRASADLTKLAFSSRYVAFAPGGLSEAPGSAYVNDTTNGDVTVISKLPNGKDIQLIPGAAESGMDVIPHDSIRIPDVSDDGSHIVMATPDCIRYLFGNCPGARTRLFVNVDGAVTHEIAGGGWIDRYVGMTDDGSRIYFLSSEQVTADDTDSSADLFAWESESDTYTRISIGDGGTGNTDACNSSENWTIGCGVQPVLGDCPVEEDKCSTPAWVGTILGSNSGNWASRAGGAGGSGLTDNSIAGRSGDLYFYSPERLDGGRGVEGRQNLYLFRDGKAHFVSSMDPGQYCYFEQASEYCNPGPIVRIQVSPDGDKAAFLTASPMTSYDNDGYLQMYAYDADSGEIQCVSCMPNGSPPGSHVEASQNGYFMTDDGRSFFSTKDPLVAQDTNGIRDVYEYVDGSPRLISAGTGAVTAENGPEYDFLYTGRSLPGLTGVSRDGRDVYFATFDVLVGQDNNGNQLKFYNARTNGGFPYVPPVPPCAAADECHGVGSSAVQDPITGTQQSFGDGGNMVAPKKAKKKKSAKKKPAKKRANKKKARKGKRAANGGQNRG